MRDIAQPKLFHDCCAVRLDSLDAEMQHIRDLLIGMTLADQLQHLALTTGERVVGIAYGSALIAASRVRNVRACGRDC